MTNTKKFALEELRILEKESPTSLLLEFKKEILDLCEAFGKSGQSGGSAPYIAHDLTNKLKSLLLQNPEETLGV